MDKHFSSGKFGGLARPTEKHSYDSNTLGQHTLEVVDIHCYLSDNFIAGGGCKQVTIARARSTCLGNVWGTIDTIDQSLYTKKFS